MDILDIVRTLLRRWYVVVPVLVATAAFAFVVVRSVDAQYEAAGSFLLTNASMMGESGEGDISLDVMLQMVQWGEVRRRVVEKGGTAKITTDDTVQEVIRVQAEGESEQEAVETVQLALEELRREVADRQAQAGVPADERGATEVLAAPTSAQERTGDGTEGSTYVALGLLHLSAPGEQFENPYAAAPASTVRILEEVITGPQVQEDLSGAHGPMSYQVTFVPRDAAPILNLTVQSPSPDRSLDAFEAVGERLDKELEARQGQAGVPERAMLTLQPLAEPDGATLLGSEARRPLITVLVVGVVTAVSLAVLVEGLASGSRRTHFTGGGIRSADQRMRPGAQRRRDRRPGVDTDDDETGGREKDEDLGPSRRRPERVRKGAG